MRLQGLSPGMQNAEEADLGTEMLGIGSDFQQGCGAGLEQEREENPLVLPDQRDQRVRHAEDQVIVAHRQQFLLAGAQPLLAGVGLALRTVAISAGVVRDGLMAAANTLIAMPAERGRAAAFDGAEHLELCPGQATRR